MPSPSLSQAPRRQGPRVHISVSQEVITTNSIKGDSSHCMIAEAIKETIPEAAYVSVDLQTIRWSDPKRGVRYIFLTPAIAQSALVDFDLGEPVVPFEFQLRGAHVMKISSSADRANRKGRPLAKGPKTIVNSHGATELRGGAAPPVAALSNSRGRVRRYGLRQLRSPAQP
jgi:hypothetical protein